MERKKWLNKDVKRLTNWASRSYNDTTKGSIVKMILDRVPIVFDAND